MPEVTSKSCTWYRFQYIGMCVLWLCYRHVHTHTHMSGNIECVYHRIHFKGLCLSWVFQISPWQSHPPHPTPYALALTCYIMLRNRMRKTYNISSNYYSQSSDSLVNKFWRRCHLVGYIRWFVSFVLPRHRCPRRHCSFIFVTYIEINIMEKFYFYRNTIIRSLSLVLFTHYFVGRYIQ